MAQSLNKVMLIGRLGRDPEIRSFQNGGKIANFRIATSKSWKDRNSGEKREKTEWHSIAVKAEHTVRFVEQYVQKGDLVYVEGELETRKWQAQDGSDRYSTEIVIAPYSGSLSKLSGSNSNGGGGQSGGSGYDNRSSGGGSDYGSPTRDLDDEIPF